MDTEWVFIIADYMKKQTDHNLKSDLSADLSAEALAKVEISTKAARREIKLRPRMKVSGAALKRPSKFAGLSIIKKKK